MSIDEWTAETFRGLIDARLNSVSMECGEAVLEFTQYSTQNGFRKFRITLDENTEVDFIAAVTQEDIDDKGKEA